MAASSFKMLQIAGKTDRTAYPKKNIKNIIPKTISGPFPKSWGYPSSWMAYFIETSPKKYHDRLAVPRNTLRRRGFQWPFQEPRLDVPTIYKAYFVGLWFRGFTFKVWPEIWYERTSICWIREFCIENGYRS